MLNFTSILTPHFLLNYAVAQAELVGASGSITVYTNYFCTTPAPYPFPGFNFGDYQDSDSDNFAVVDYEYSGPRLWPCWLGVGWACRAGCLSVCCRVRGVSRWVGCNWVGECCVVVVRKTLVVG